MAARTVELNGVKWKLLFTNRMYHKDDGACADPTNVLKDRKIRVRKSLEGKRKLIVLLHELLHAADWSKDESWVEKIAEDIGQIVWDSGFRDTPPETLQNVGETE